MAYNADKHEKEILKFWDNENIFQRSVEEKSPSNPYVFYDGPPFATGLPHYGHIVASVMKDAIPRYYTMQGKRVERVWGWDCHGLPIENIVEKELNTTSKQDIEAMGIDVFNERCRTKVLSYVQDWEKTIHRLGRFVDMKNSYKTMDKDYMESVWWVFKQLWDKDLIYKGYKPMHICPRCETTLSQQEVSEGYKMVKDLSVTAQFKITNKKSKEKKGEELFTEIDGEIFFLAWTTTPWTLPGNVLLAVGEGIQYAVVKLDGAHYIVAQDLVMHNFEGKEFEVVEHVNGQDLVGLEYEPLFPYFADSKNSFRVVAAEFVEATDGTGIVHLAPAFGTDDYEVFKKEDVPFIQHVGMNGRFVDAVVDFAGMHVKPLDDHMKTDVEIIKYLAHNGKLFSKKKYEHSYPHCWRCDTPLINYATDSWFVAVTKVKERAIEEAKKINWSPEHIKEGRFGKWLEGARDWSISRQRFWASVMPVWQCELKHSDCEYVVVGSAQELEEVSGAQVDDLHKHIVDAITFDCKNCGGKMRRVPDVLDTWFDSGSMPYAQVHYPFENETTFEAGFPAEFIAEGQDQTRAWFYYLHVLATALKGSPAYQNVIVNGIVLAEDGKKMSKKLQNYPDPNKVLETYGADALRFYLLSSPVMQAENLSFSESGVRELFNKTVNSVANVLSFYEMYAGDLSVESLSFKGAKNQQTHVLDTWILARLQELVRDVTDGMDRYHLPDATRPIQEFIADLSQWYLRRSRDRMKSEGADKKEALATLRYVLLELAKIMAPFMPFIAEKVFLSVQKDDRKTKKDSVHLQDWPTIDEKLVHEEVLQKMIELRKVVELSLSARKEAGVKVRQPLGVLNYFGVEFSADFEQLIVDEVNVQKVINQNTQGADFGVVKQDGTVSVALSTTLTEELEKEGLLRELVRAVNILRKDAGFTREDKAKIVYDTTDELLLKVFQEYAKDLTNATASGNLEQAKVEGEEIKLNERTIKLSVVKE